MRVRRATDADVDFLVELYADEDVRPFLAAGRPYDRDWVAAHLDGLFVTELDGERAGAMAWELKSERNGIVHVSGLAVHPDFRGRRLADEAARLFQRHLLLERGFHRIELEVYGFNERAQRHAERSGFVREGVKRQAYRRGDGWVDGVLYALVAEDLDAPR
jgi:RimJ/RimL family protein N-acetyltransferase